VAPVPPLAIATVPVTLAAVPVMLPAIAFVPLIATELKYVVLKKLFF
jgi:hypothetical protein